MARLGGCVLRGFAVSIALMWASGCSSVHSSANHFADVQAQSSEQSASQTPTTAPPPPAPSQGRMLTLDLADRADSVGDPPYTEPLFSKEYGSLLWQDTRYV